MINAFEIPEFKFDSEKLKQTYLNNKNVWAMYGPGEKPKTNLHTQYVSKEDVLEHINQLKNYKELIDNVKFFKTYAEGVITPHTDNRKVGLNIPVIIGKNDKITFFESKEEEEVVLQVEGKKIETAARQYKNTKLIETFVRICINCFETKL